MLKSGKTVIMLLTIMSLLSGCFRERSELAPLKDGKGKIRVVYQDEDRFYSDYGNFFKMMNPDIDIEVISEAELFDEAEKNEAFNLTEEKKKLLDKVKPDVLFLNESMFEAFAQEGRLYDIEPAISQDQYNLDGFMPGLIDRLRAKGNGKLYGLTPSFETNVIYYNRNLFKKHQIEPPNGKMTWKELIDLAARFSSVESGKKQVFGLYQTRGPASLMYDIAAASALKLVDAKSGKLLIESDGWKEAMKMTADAVRNHAAYAPPPVEEGEQLDGYEYTGDYLKQYSRSNEMFYMGQAAMTIQPPWFASFLRDIPYYSKTPEIDWGIAAAPVNPAKPDESAYVKLSEIYAISADSPNKRAAWEFVKFVNGPEMAQVAGKAMNDTLPTRSDYFKDFRGRDTEAFYLLKPMEASSVSDKKSIPPGFQAEFDSLLSDALKSLIDQEKTLDDAVAELQLKGQEMLDRLRETK
ncbi:extracellular solute-binding protein [Paenibacillus sp. chi10]|uniref:Extracellular solute-binding protein n=1 Tax=Paenibacillus suaedae TaxID=3077233 RepID=A0AAJ2JZC4_9BACL|nr:extracellular solute-binding protein [Paenibacillus sp. chi10]MDT8979142.1 extracellular solute-binding protein [Paenibacillus sp. chi10]